jgi:hypothetical protein
MNALQVVEGAELGQGRRNSKANIVMTKDITTTEDIRDLGAMLLISDLVQMMMMTMMSIVT